MSCSDEVDRLSPQTCKTQGMESPCPAVRIQSLAPSLAPVQTLTVHAAQFNKIGLEAWSTFGLSSEQPGKRTKI